MTVFHLTRARTKRWISKDKTNLVNYKYKLTKQTTLCNNRTEKD